MLRVLRVSRARRWIPLVVASVACGCPQRAAPPLPIVPVPPPAPAVEFAPLELWVDASAPAGGDGSAARPHRALGEAFVRAGAARARFHLRTGMYPGPFVLPAGAALDGPESAVLFAEGGEAAVVTASDGALSGVSLQGGAVGLVVTGRVRAEGVHFSGQRRAAVEVRGGDLELVRADVRATLSETVGVGLERGRALISACAFSGPFRRAVLAARAAGGPEVEVAVERTRFSEAVTAIHLAGARGRLRDILARGGRGPAVFVGGGDMEVAGLEVDGHEYALLGREAGLKVRGFTSRQAERAALALVGGRAQVEDLVVSDSGSSGAVDVVGGYLALRRFRIDRPGPYGVHVRSARVELSSGEISGAAADRDGDLGDGLHLRDVKGTVERVTARQLAGSGMLLGEASEVSGSGLVFERCRWGGVVVETLSRFDGRTIAVRDCGGAALVVPSEAIADVDGLTSTRNQDGAVWADCGAGARVTVRSVVDDAPRPRGPCVREER